MKSVHVAYLSFLLGIAASYDYSKLPGEYAFISRTDNYLALMQNIDVNPLIRIGALFDRPKITTKTTCKHNEPPENCKWTGIFSGLRRSEETFMLNITRSGKFFDGRPTELITYMTGDNAWLEKHLIDGRFPLTYRMVYDDDGFVVNAEVNKKDEDGTIVTMMKFKRL